MSNQDKQHKIEQRCTRPQTLAASFGSLMSAMGYRVNSADLSENWRGIVGNEIANISNIVAIKTTRDKKFNIVLRPVSPAFALELSYKVNDITNSINNYFGGDKVDKITIRK